MKKNQLFGFLALMLALGMNFPATTFSAPRSDHKAGVTDLSFELMDETIDLKSSEIESTVSANELAEATSETGTLPTEEEDGKTEDEEEDDDDDNDDDKDQNNPPEDPEIPENLDNSDTDIIDPKTISSYAELITVLQDESISEIRLVNDLIVDGDIEIGRSAPLTLDLNGHSIISCGNEMVGCDNARVINVEYGDLRVIGKGNIMAMGPNGVALSIRGSVNDTTANYSTVTIGSEVNLLAPNSYAVLIAPSANAAYGINLYLEGGISADNGIYNNSSIRGVEENAPRIHFGNTATITTEKTAISATGYANWEFSGTTITSGTGIDACTGNFTFINTHIITNASGPNNQGTGAVFKFDHKNLDGVTLTINSGIYKSEHNLVFFDPHFLAGSDSAIESLEILDGVFISPVGIFPNLEIDQDNLDLDIAVRGGRFSADITDFLAPGMHLESTDNNDYIVVDENALEVLRTKAELQALIDTARSKDITFYTEESYQKLSHTIKKAELVVGEDSDLEQINSASHSLNKALKSLEPINTTEPGTLGAARQELSNAINSAKALDPVEYDSSDYRELMDLISQAEALLARPGTTHDDIDRMLGEIDATHELLMVYDEEQAVVTARLSLESLIDENNTLLSEADSTDSTYDTLRTLLVEASALLAPDSGATRDEIENMYVEVSLLSDEVFSRAPLTPESDTDKTVEELYRGLSEMLEAVAELTIGDYRSEFTSQYYDLQAAIAEARDLLGHQDTPAASLAETMNKILVSTSGLKDSNTYDQPSTTPVSPASSTQPAPIQSTPTQFAPVQPTPVQSAPTPVLDTTVLGEIIARIAKLNSEKYTADSYGQILSILEQAKSALGATSTTQTDIDQIVLNLYQATMDLVVVPPHVEEVPSQDTNYTSTFSSDNLQVQNDNIQPQSQTQPQPAVTVPATNDAGLQPVADDAVTPSLMMSALAGIYTGLAMYRKSRVAAKHSKQLKRLQH